MKADTLLRMDMTTSWADIMWGVIGGLIAIGVIVVLTVVTGGIGTAIAGLGFSAGALTALTAGTILKTVLVGSVVGIVAYNSASLGDQYVIPVYSLSPEEIFQNRLPLFNVNFFDPDANKDKYNLTYKKEEDITEGQLIEHLVDYGAIKGNQNLYFTTNKKNKPIGSKWTEVWVSNGNVYSMDCERKNKGAAIYVEITEFRINGSKIKVDGNKIEEQLANTVLKRNR